MGKRIKMLEYFQAIYIINLPERLDRRKEVESQLGSIGLTISNPQIKLFDAIRPEGAEEFDTVGTRGCFLSHLGVLKDALKHRYQRVLILEDDVNFSDQFNTKMSETINMLDKAKWDVFYGGHKIQAANTSRTISIQDIPPANNIITTHFVAFQGGIIEKTIQELELMLTRKNGDPKGGPMHIDGAYSTIRKNHPQYKTLAAFPVLGSQRASRTDIHSLRWFDKVFLVRDIITIFRKFKNSAFKINIAYRSINLFK